MILDNVIQVTNIWLCLQKLSSKNLVHEHLLLVDSDDDRADRQPTITKVYIKEKGISSRGLGGPCGHAGRVSDQHLLVCFVTTCLCGRLGLRAESGSGNRIREEGGPVGYLEIEWRFWSGPSGREVSRPSKKSADSFLIFCFSV